MAIAHKAEVVSISGPGAVAHDLSIIGLVMQADMVVKLVLMILLLASFYCWVIIFNKLVRFKHLRSSTEKFERVFWSGQLLDNLYERVKDKVNHPMAAVFVAAMHEWGRRRGAGKDDETQVTSSLLRTGVKERIFQAMQVAHNRSMGQLEKNLTFLATVGATAPFIGLFGTVWGIMNSFQSIAASKNTTLVVVAPGIAEALFATAVGLFAAIPAVIFYNIFTGELNRYALKLEDFSNELGALLSRELDENK